MPDGSLPALIEGAPLDVLVAPAPYQRRLERMVVEPGMTVAEILLRACQEGVLDPQDLSRTEVDIDGKRIDDRESIADIHPRPGQIVNVTVQVYGGGKGGNKALQAVLQVAIMVAAFAIAGPAGAAAGGWAQAANLGVNAVRVATIAAQVAASTAVTLAGGALISALAPSSKTDGAAQTYSLESQTNQARLREQFPLCLGKRRWAFDLASSAYTTFTGDDMWITAIYALHFGPCTLTDLKIGETLLTAYPAGEVQQETFLTPGPRNSTLYPTNIHQDSFQNTLDRVHGDYATATTVDDATTVELDFYWAGGLYYAKGDGRTVNSDTKILVQISPYGTNTWQAAPGLPAGTDKSGNAYPAGTYYVQAASKTPVRRTLTVTLPSKGHWDVRIKRDTRPVDDTNQDTVTWTAIRMPRPGKPVLDETLSILVLKVKAAQDLSGSLGVISGVVTPIVPIPGSDGSWSTTAASDNAAALTRWLLTGPAAAKPLSASEIDASCAEQYALIEANGWQGGELVNGGTQQDALNKLAAAGRMLIYWSGSAVVFVPDWTKDAPRQMFAGRNAQGYRRKRTYPDELHAVWVEFINAGEDWKPDGLMVYADGYDATTATLIEKLSLGFACLPDRAHREGRVYEARRKLQVWTHEFTAGADGVVASYGDRVRARRTSGLYEQADARVSHRRWSGSLVSGVRLDSGVRMKAGENYAVDIRRPSGLVIGVPVVTTPGLVRDIVFATPLPTTQAPGKGDLLAFGKVNSVTEDLEIVDIAPQSDGTVQISAANYVGDALVAAETGTIPALTTFLSERVAAPIPRILATQGSPAGVFVGFDVDQQRTATIRGFVARWRITPASGSASSWSTLPVLAPNERSFTTPAILDAQHQSGDGDGEVRVDVELWTVMATGEASPAATANGILIYQGVLPVTNFAAAGVIRTAPDGSSYPALQVSADAVLSGAVQDLVVEQQPAGSSPAAWVSAGHSLPAANPVGDFTAVAGGKSYDVRGRWRDANGWVGSWTILLARAIPADGLISASTNSVPDAATVGGGGKTASQLLSDVQGLIDGYGSTGSAAGSAADAEAAAALALTYKNAAQSSSSDALGYRNAASGSADTANAHAGEAGDFAAAAHADRLAADASASGAAGSAGVAGTQAAAASASQAAAQTSAAVAARVGYATLNKNPTFALYPDADAATFPGQNTGDASGWFDNSYAWRGASRVVGQDSPYAYRVNDTAADAGVVLASNQDASGPAFSPGWYVFEAHITLNSGTLANAGVSVAVAVSNGGTYLGGDVLRFWADPDTGGVVQGAGAAGATYRFSKLIDLRLAAGKWWTFYVFTNGIDSVGPARDITWHKAGMRPAYDQEIAAHKATGDIALVAANLSDEETARADGDGALASRVSTTEAKFNGQPNLVQNPSFAQGASGWTLSNGVVAGGNGSDVDGPYVVNFSVPDNTTTYFRLAEQLIYGVHAGIGHSLQVKFFSDAIAAPTTFLRCVVVWEDASNGSLGEIDLQTNARASWTNFKLNGTDDGRLTPPAGTHHARVVLDLTSSSGNIRSTGGAAAATRVKLEMSPVCSVFSDERLSAAVQVTEQALAAPGIAAAALGLQVTADAGTGHPKVSGLRVVAADGSVSISAVLIDTDNFVVKTPSGAELTFGDAPGEAGVLTVRALRVLTGNIGEGQVSENIILSAPGPWTYSPGSGGYYG